MLTGTNAQTTPQHAMPVQNKEQTVNTLSLQTRNTKTLKQEFTMFI